MARGVLLGRRLQQLYAPHIFGSFNPVSLFANGETGMIYDPTDITTLFQTTDTSTPVTAHTDPIGSILDKSGNGWTIAQATAADRPLYNVAGSVKSMLFDGVSDNLQITTGNARNVFRNKPYGTIVGALKSAAIGGSTRLVYFSTNSVANDRAVLGKSSTQKMFASGRRLDADTNANLGSIAAIDGTSWYVGCAEYDWANALLHISMNLAARETLNPFQTAGNTSDTASALIRLGATNMAAFLNGNGGRIIILGRAMTAGERIASIKWCGEGAGLALS